MSAFHRLGNNQPYFRNNFENQQEKENFDFFTDAREYNIRERSNKSFNFLKRLGGERKGVRLAIKDKKPQYPTGSNWPTIEEQRTIEELVRKYGEHGERTGTRRGKLYFEVWDIDITHLSQRLPTWLQRQVKNNFELIAKIYRFSYIKTQHGYQVYLLFEELSPNCEIFHRDSWKKVKRNVGSILSKGRQVQGVSSEFKEWVNNGAWFWKLKNVGELAKILKKFFFEVDLKVNNEEKIEQKGVNSINPNEINLVNSQNLKSNENSSKSLYKFLKLQDLKIISKKPTKRANHYRINYLDKWQKRGWFFLDSYYRDKKEIVQPNLIGNFMLVRGCKYQFFASFA